MRGRRVDSAACPAMPPAASASPCATSSWSGAASPDSPLPGTCAIATSWCSRAPGGSAGASAAEARDPYWLNLGAHVFSGPGSATGRLVADVGVESVPVPGHLVALELNGRLLVGGRPELYPFRLPLRPAERVALARAGARLRVAAARYERAAAPRPGESPAETRRRLLAHGDDRTFSDWLGELPGDADLMFRATVTRSTAEPEEITAGAGTGYFALVWSSGGGLSRNIVGGAGVLIDGIAAELPGRIVHGCRRPGDRAGGRPRARPLPLRRSRPRAASTPRDRRNQGLRRRPADPRPARRHALGADVDSVRPDRRHGDADERDATHALGRPLRTGHAEARVQHALQHRQRAAPAQLRCVLPAAA